jgi:hypothetical protein
VGAATADVVIVKNGDAVAPAATVTETGTPMPEVMVVKFTVIPPAGAGPVRFTLLNVVETPPTIAAGESATESKATGFTVRFAVLVAPLYDAEIGTTVWAATYDVVIVKTGDAVAPAATVTVGGTPTPKSVLVKFTRMPPAGAGAFRVILLAIDEAPPTTDVGDSATASRPTGFTVRFAVLVTPL